MVMSSAQKSPGTPLNLPYNLHYPVPEHSHGRGFYRLEIEDKVKDWLENETIKYQYSYAYTADTPIIWFEKEEDRVKFILRWM